MQVIVKDIDHMVIQPEFHTQKNCYIKCQQEQAREVNFDLVVPWQSVDQ